MIGLPVACLADECAWIAVTTPSTCNEQCSYYDTETESYTTTGLAVMAAYIVSPRVTLSAEAVAGKRGCSSWVSAPAAPWQALSLAVTVFVIGRAQVCCTANSWESQPLRIPTAKPGFAVGRLGNPNLKGYLSLEMAALLGFGLLRARL